MSQGNDLVDNAASTDPESGTPEEVWFVAVTGDDVKQMTLDEVADAFQAGMITSQTAVWTEGMEAWAPLGEVADLGDEPEAGSQFAEPEPVPHGIAEPVQSAGVFPAAPLQAEPQAPLTSLGAPASSASLGGSPQISEIPQAPFVQSTVPVALSVEEDEPVLAKPERRVGRWLLAAAGIVAAGVTALNFDAISGGSDKASAKVTVKAVKTLAARPFDPGADEKSPDKEKPAAVEAKAEKNIPKGDLPIGTATVGEEEAQAPAAGGKKSLRANFSSSLKKKKKKKKASKKKYKKRAKAKSTRRRKKRSRRKSTRKKTVKRTESAFDPLNGSLP